MRLLRYHSTTIEVLTTECDPSSAVFGIASYKVDGGVLFKCRHPEDRERLIESTTARLLLFITENLDVIKAALARNGLERPRRSMRT